MLISPGSYAASHKEIGLPPMPLVNNDGGTIAPAGWD